MASNPMESIVFLRTTLKTATIQIDSSGRQADNLLIFLPAIIEIKQL